MLTNWFQTNEPTTGTGSFMPLLDMNETDTNYEIKVDLPGLQASDLRVEVTDNVLTVSGERKSEHSEKGDDGKTPHYVERYYGRFSRSIVLPSAVDRDKIDAQYRDGVLKIMLPKAEEAKRSQIEIKS